MNTVELRAALTPKNRRTTVSTSMLGPAADELPVAGLGGRRLVIEHAELAAGDPIRLHGRCDLLHVKNLPVELTAEDSGNGAARLLLRFTLPHGWTFGTSFPELPHTPDWDPAHAARTSVQLDQLALSGAEFVFATEACPHPVRPGVDLAAGLNFVADLAAGAALGDAAALLGHSGTHPLFGQVRLKGARTAPPLGPGQWPWQDPRALLPGISLRAELGLATTVRGARFEGVVLRVHSPLTRQWLDQNPTYGPVVAYTGRFTLGAGETASGAASSEGSRAGSGAGGADGVEGAGGTSAAGGAVGAGEPSHAGGVEAEAVAPVETGARTLPLLVSFRGATLAELSGLAPLLGKQDPRALLPAELSRTLGRIELERAGVELSALPGHEGVSWVSVTVGLPGLSWPVAGDLLTVTALHATFEAAPALRLGLTGRVEIGGVPVEVTASSDDGLTLYARAAPERPLDLAALLTRYAPGVTAPSGLLVDMLAAEIAPGRHYAMALTMAAGHPWHLPLGPAGLTVADLSLHLTKPHDGPAGGSVSGRVDLAQVGSVEFGYARPGPLLLRGFVPRARLSELAAALLGRPVALPEGFDLDFRDSTALIRAEGEEYLFQFGTHLDGLGSLVLQMQRVGGDWGLAAGLDLGDGGAAALPAVGGVAEAFRQRFGLRKLLVVLATFDGADIHFPDLAVFDDPRLAGQPPRPAHGLRAGLTVYAQWALDPARHEERLLSRLLGEQPVFDVALHLGTNPARDAVLLADYRTTVLGRELRGAFGGRIDDGRISLFLEGTLPLEIQGQVQTLGLRLRFLPNGALLSGSMTGPTAIGFGGFQLADLAVELGIDWEGVPTLGVAATVAAPGLTSSVAVLFDSTDPGRSLVAGSLGDLTMRQVADAIAGAGVPEELAALLDRIAIRGTGRFTIDGGLAPYLDALDLRTAAPALRAGGLTLTDPGKALLIVLEPGRSWHLTDRSGPALRHYRLTRTGAGAASSSGAAPGAGTASGGGAASGSRGGPGSDPGPGIEVSLDAQLYAAPQDVRIDAIHYPQGCLVSGELELFGLRSRSEVTVRPRTGLSVESTLDRVVVGDERVFVLEGDRPGAGPRLSVATFARPEHADPREREPHASIHGTVLLFGMRRALDLELTADGLDFGVEHDPLPGLRLKLDLRCRLRGHADLEVDGTVELTVGTVDLGPLGRLAVDSGLRGRLRLRVQGESTEAGIGGTLTVLGRTHDWSRSLHVDALSPEGLARTAQDAVADYARSALASARAWVEAVRDGLVTGTDDVGRVLTEHFGLRSADEVAALLALLPDLGPVLVLEQLVALGFDERARSSAMTEVFRWGAAVVDAADLTVTDAARRLGDLFGIEREKVKLVVFNRTDHVLLVTGVRGDEIERGPDGVVLPGAAGVVGVFRDAGGRWEWVYLQDQTTGEEYQLYIERTRSSTQYAAFGYRDDRATSANGDPRPFAGGVGTASWDRDSPTAAYWLLRAPHRPGTPPPAPGRAAERPGTLRVGEYLLPGERITSPAGRYALLYGPDNLLVQLDADGQVVWRSPGLPSRPGVCVLQRDGNLVIYDRYAKATWATATRGPANVLRIEDSGSLELHSGSGGRIWANH